MIQVVTKTKTKSKVYSLEPGGHKFKGFPRFKRKLFSHIIITGSHLIIAKQVIQGLVYLRGHDFCIYHGDQGLSIYDLLRFHFSTDKIDLNSFD